MGLGNKHGIELLGYNLTYYRSGSGEPLILVHGITTYSFIWRRVVPLLQEKYDVIAIDLFGCGDSDKPLTFSYSIKQHAQFLYKFATSLGFDKFHLVGHDIGGGISQRFAAEHPELLYDLVIMNGVGYNFWPVQPIIAMRTPIIRQFIMGILDVRTLRLIVKRGVYNKNRVNEELMRLFWEPFKTKEGRKAFLHFTKSLDNNDLMEIEEDLRQLNIPVLIIRGDADVYLSSEIAQRLKREIPGSKLALIPDAGHFLQEDAPEEVARLILEFYKDINHAHG